MTVNKFSYFTITSQQMTVNKFLHFTSKLCLFYFLALRPMTMPW